MKGKVYYLSTCDTCKRIMKDWQLSDAIERQDLKKQAISESELQELYAQTNSYEALLNKRAKMLRDHKISTDKEEREQEIKSLILSHYSFLKRPILNLGNQIFVGNSPQIVAAAKAALNGNDS